MLITKEVEVKWNAKNIKMYVGKGYIFTKLKDVVKIDLYDLAENSTSEIEFKCDYCGTHYFKKWVYHNRNIKRSTSIEKDCCHDCIKLKTKESNVIKYGFEFPQQAAEIQAKIQNTTLERYGDTCFLNTEESKQTSKKLIFEKYGVENPFQSNEIKDKIKKSNLEKYGVEFYSQTDECKTKSKETLFNNYGVEHAMQSDILKQNAHQTLMKNYGVEHALQNKDILNKMKTSLIKKYNVDNVSKIEDIKIKKAETFYKNGTIATSRQQLYVYKILGGILNYSVDTPSLDIAFPDKMIYIEVNGSGHDLGVKMGNMTQEEFYNKEKRRYYYLKNRGWKGIFINTKSDYIPKDEILIGEVNKALEWFKVEKEGHSHYNINIGNIVNDKKYGRLRKITDKDL